MNSFLIFIIIILSGVIIYLLFYINNYKKSRISKPEIIEELDKLDIKLAAIETNILEEIDSNIQTITKSNAITYINKYSEFDYLTSANTSFSNINKAVPIWWFNIAPEKFEEELHLILAKNKSFIWIKLPAGSVSNPKRKFRFRDDKGLIELKISSNPGYNYLRDETSGGIGFGFQQYVQKEFKN